MSDMSIEKAIKNLMEVLDAAVVRGVMGNTLSVVEAYESLQYLYRAAKGKVLEPDQKTN